VKTTQKVTPPLYPLPQGEGSYEKGTFSKSGFGIVICTDEGIIVI
jgi:hypothetical protein